MEPAPITVTTASVPERATFLAENIASIGAQTVPVYAHLIRIKSPSLGCANPVDLAEQRNALLAAVETEWLAILDDDDWWLPHHVATIAPLLSDADVVYTSAENLGKFDDINAHPDIPGRLRSINLLPVASAVRTEFAKSIGGWGGDFDGKKFVSTGATWDDWDFWIRCAEAGARFRCSNVATWHYRFHTNQAANTWG